MFSMQLLNAALCTMLCLYLFNSPALRPLASRLLAVNYGLFALQSGLLLAVLAGGIGQIEPTYFADLRATMALVLGPSLLLYYRAVIFQQLNPINALHFIPALVLFIGLFIAPSLLNWVRPFIDGLIITSFAVYLTAGVYLLAKFGQLTHLGAYARNAKRYLTLLILMMVVNIAIDLGVVAEIRYDAHMAPYNTYSLSIGAALFTLLHAITVYLAMIRSPLIDWMREREVTKQTSKPLKESPLEEQEAQAIYARWQKKLETEQWYLLEDGLSISRAAKKMVVPSRKLSQAINRFYGASYSQMINDYRVAKAKELLKQKIDLPITEVMMASGFNTKSQFHREFSRVTGMSPSGYRLAPS